MDQGQYTKTVEYDRVTRDYAAYMNGNLVGYFNTRAAADTALSLMAINYLRRHQ